jgi:hypothetical protein
MYRTLVCTVLASFVGILCSLDHRQCSFKGESQRIEVSETFSTSVFGDAKEEIFQTWRKSCAEARSYSFEVEAKNTIPAFGQAKTALFKIKLMIHQDDNCSVRVDTIDDKNKLIHSTIIVGTKWLILSYKEKTIYHNSLQSSWTKERMGRFADYCFPVVPFFPMNEAELNKVFKTAVIQKDQDYTWIRFTPVQPRLACNAAQVGVINYSNSVSPRFFPLCIQWQETGGEIVSWNFKKVHINDPVAVSKSDFMVDIAQLEGDGWKSSHGNGLLSLFWNLYFVESPDWVKDKMNQKIPKSSK